MSMTILTICLIGALLELDTAYAFQLGVSRGIVVGPILSLIVGDYFSGIQIGVFVDLLLSDSIPLGGELPPSKVICCVIGMAMVSLKWPVAWAFFAGIVGAYGFCFVEKKFRDYFSNRMETEEKVIMKAPEKINTFIVETLGKAFIVNFIFLLISTIVVGFIGSYLLGRIPAKLNESVKIAYLAVPWIGLATIVSNFSFKGRVK